MGGQSNSPSDPPCLTPTQDHDTKNRSDEEGDVGVERWPAEEEG